MPQLGVRGEVIAQRRGAAEEGEDTHAQGLVSAHGGLELGGGVVDAHEGIERDVRVTAGRERPQQRNGLLGGPAEFFEVLRRGGTSKPQRGR